jgi:hypothetical protein
MKVNIRRSGTHPTAGTLIACHGRGVLEAPVNFRQSIRRNGYLVSQRNNEHVAGLNSKRRRLVSMLIDVAVPHVPLIIERVVYCKREPQGSPFAAENGRFAGFTPFGCACEHLLSLS